jgi:proteasome lid subunit RPN8/RPN11
MTLPRAMGRLEGRENEKGGQSPGRSLPAVAPNRGLASKGYPILSMPFRLRIPRSLYERMLAQALAELPNECCGLLAGRIRDDPCGPVGEAAHCYPLVNAARSPVEYLSEPRSMFEAVRAMRGLDEEILAVYHSHPTSEPMPSRTDREQNFSPEVINVILSLQDGTPRVRAWWLTSEDYREAAWELTESLQPPALGT